MAKITDYPKTPDLVSNDVFLLDGDRGTKTILASDLGEALLGLMSTKDILNNIDIEELDSIDAVNGNDSFLIQTSSGNRKMKISDAVFKILDATINSETRKTIWRGKNIGNAITQEQFDRIEDGTFKGMFVGDYWVIGNNVWRIVDFDYWYMTGDKTCSKHHVVIMPDKVLYDAQMNETADTSTGYVGSKMRTENLMMAFTIIYGAFGQGHILSYRDYLTNSITSNMVLSNAWFDASVELPSEMMIYGAHFFSPGWNGGITPSSNRYAQNYTQLAGFQLNRQLIHITRASYWLRDAGSPRGFCLWYGDGRALYTEAVLKTGVRPVFPIAK